MENRELIKKASAAKSAKELQELAKANSVELTEAEAESYFSRLHKSGELSDEELDNVAGGGCQARGLVQKGKSELLVVGDVFKAHDIRVARDVYCRCGSNLFRATNIRDANDVQKVINSVCTQCGSRKEFVDDERDDHYVFHKHIL